MNHHAIHVSPGNFDMRSSLNRQYTHAVVEFFTPEQVAGAQAHLAYCLEVAAEPDLADRLQSAEHSLKDAQQKTYDGIYKPAKEALKTRGITGQSIAFRDQLEIEEGRIVMGDESLAAERRRVEDLSVIVKRLSCGTKYAVERARGYLSKLERGAEALSWSQTAEGAQKLLAGYKAHRHGPMRIVPVHGFAERAKQAKIFAGQVAPLTGGAK